MRRTNSVPWILAHYPATHSGAMTAMQNLERMGRGKDARRVGSTIGLLTKAIDKLRKFPAMEAENKRMREALEAISRGDDSADGMQGEIARAALRSAPDAGEDRLCRRCGKKMDRGLAIEQTLVGGIKDFSSDTAPVTLSAVGPGKLVDCWKCPSCGHSMTDGAE